MIISVISPVRNKETIFDYYRIQSLKGHIVLLPVFVTPEEHTRNEDALMELHKLKLDLAEEVVVLTVDGYMGRGTYEEMGYCAAKGIPHTLVDYSTETGTYDRMYP